MTAAVLLVAEFIATRMPTVSVRASTIVETRPGVFMAAWYGGSLPIPAPGPPISALPPSVLSLGFSWA